MKASARPTANPEAMEIGARVRQVREGRALTQQEVADRAGMGTAMISRIEHGHRKPRAKTLRRLAEALDVAVERLTGATDLGTGRVVLSSPPRENRGERFGETGGAHDEG